VDKRQKFLQIIILIHKEFRKVFEVRILLQQGVTMTVVILTLTLGGLKMKDGCETWNLRANTVFIQGTRKTKTCVKSAGLRTFSVHTDF
jgi:hypothetical protein